MIAIIDYGAGNLRSVSNAISQLGYQSKIINRPSELFNAQAVILPGVGAAADTLQNLKAMGMVGAIQQFIREDRPFLGICLGLQILLSGTEEGGWHECLNILPGQVRRLPHGLRIPHMGWNQVKQKASHPIFDGIPDEANFYFVHSYYAEPEDKSLIIGETDYGIPLCSIIAKGNLIATQFHPEKSGGGDCNIPSFGLKIYDNFIKMALMAKVSSN